MSQSAAEMIQRGHMQYLMTESREELAAEASARAALRALGGGGGDSGGGGYSETELETYTATQLAAQPSAPYIPAVTPAPFYTPLDRSHCDV
jgi:hypothetical protein